jgi:calcium-binding protein CML
MIVLQERWAEMDWDSDGNIDFEEFVFTFSKWMDLGDDEDKEDGDGSA